MKLSSLVKNAADVTALQIPFGDVSINIKYSRQKYTPKFEKELKKMTDEGLPASSLAHFVCTLVLEWDITDDNGKAIPLNEEALDEVPTVVQQRIVEAIAEDQRPNQKPSASTNDF